MRSYNGIRLILIVGLASLGLFQVATAEDVPSVERWGVYEASFSCRAPEGRSLDIPLIATFSQGTKQIKVPGYWNGGAEYQVRFSPPTMGIWTYKTASPYRELDGQTGSLTTVAPKAGNHGPIEVFETLYLQYADGTPYHQFGTTCYAWVHQPQAMQQQTLNTLASSPFNKIRFCVFPKSYTYNENEPDYFAFKKKANGKFDFNQPDIAFWRNFERRILDLQELGIQADVILWHPYDRWGFADMSDEQDDRYLRYCLARLAAYRNVWWSLANEFDFMTNQPKGRRGNKQMADWDRFFEIIAADDPYTRMRGIHNGRIWYDHTKDWVIHASLQTSDMNRGVQYRKQYQKPVLYDECRYEGDVPQGWGNLTAREMTQRFWLGTMSGCYVGHGETYKHPKDLLWWAKGGKLSGHSPPRIQWLKDLMKSAPPFHELEPMGDDQGRFLLGKKNEYYLLYCLAGQDAELSLDSGGPYKVDALDPWEMTQWPVGSLTDGKFTAAAPEYDLVYRFTPYEPGEPLRPVAKPTASVTEGVPSLTVKFQSNTKHPVEWDFDDGSRSKQVDPTHTFKQPGIYNVIMTVKDERGSSARGSVVILVDRDTREPILRAGFGGDDLPQLKVHGSAKRQPDGGWAFSPEEPFGRIETDGEVSDQLGGLRSFTVAGWLKPASLKIGSGGNRILFCLKGSKAGIDLVHLQDGRMRLAVNQWPDRVKNDSSPGRLVAGKWTFFAVTYDATAPQDNVAWYFSDPVDARVAAQDKEVAIELDRKTSYSVGPLATRTGPLAVGNFNSTMRSQGWDRQFRGEIKGLTLLGSRISGRGALKIEAIRALR